MKYAIACILLFPFVINAMDIEQQWKMKPHLDVQLFLYDRDDELLTKSSTYRMDREGTYSHIINCHGRDIYCFDKDNNYSRTITKPNFYYCLRIIPALKRITLSNYMGGQIKKDISFQYPNNLEIALPGNRYLEIRAEVINQE